MSPVKDFLETLIWNVFAGICVASLTLIQNLFGTTQPRSFGSKVAVKFLANNDAKIIVHFKYLFRPHCSAQIALTEIYRSLANFAGKYAVPGSSVLFQDLLDSSYKVRSNSLIPASENA